MNRVFLWLNVFEMTLFFVVFAVVFTDVKHD